MSSSNIFESKSLQTWSFYHLQMDLNRREAIQKPNMARSNNSYRDRLIAANSV